MEERNWIGGVTLGLFRKEKKKKKMKLCRAFYACESLVVLAVKRLVIFN